VSYLRTFGKFWYDFIIGDDWRVALGVVAALATVDWLVRVGVDWWWLLPLAVAALLAMSVNTAARPRRSSRVGL
jgi:hypothetical protein